MLFGMDAIGMFPEDVKTMGNQRVLATRFGVGKLLVGCVPGVGTQQVNATAARLARGTWTRPTEGIIHRVEVSVPEIPQVKPPTRLAKQEVLVGCAEMDDVDRLQREVLDESPNPLRVCRACKEMARHCKECNFRAQGLTQRERQSVEYMEARMEHDPGTNTIKVAYPFVDVAARQPNNWHQVIRVQENIERRVVKDGLHSDYNAEMQRMLDSSSVRPLTNEEMEGYQGGVHYMPHFPVLNPESSSTKLRIVVDSKFRNSRSNLSFNDLIRDVPNALNDILDVQWRWRQFAIPLCYDLSKAYHTLRTGQAELHLRRFVYRFDVKDSWKAYGYCVVAFGDKPAALALELAKELTASLAMDLDPLAACQLTRNSLVDDVGGGAPWLR